MLAHNMIQQRTILIFGLTLLWSAPSWAQVPEEPELPKEDTTKKTKKTKIDITAVPLTKKEKRLIKPHLDDKSLNESLGWRFGAMFNGFFGSQQGRPLIYPYMGWRYKTNGFYLDIHAPGLLGGLDYLQYLLQQQVTNDPLNLFLTLNSPAQFVFIEAMHVRAGPIFNLRLFKSKENKGFPITVAVGLSAIADFVIFEATLLGRKFESQDDLNDNVSIDPFVVGLGGFGSLLWKNRHVTVELTAELNRDMINIDSVYLPQPGWVLGLES